MKILMTGFSPRTCGSTQVKSDYAHLTWMMRDALTELGHSVDVRVVRWGEELKGKYDCALVHIGLVNSMGSYHAPGAAWTLHELPQTSVMYCDDWSIEIFESSIRTKVIANAQWAKHIAWRGEKYAYMSANDLKEMRAVLISILNKPCPWALMAPMFPWGDHEKLIRGVINARLLSFDISPMVTIPKFTVPAVKDRRWVLATLSDQTEWVRKVGCRWPVDGYGNVRLNQPCVSEAEIVQKYADAWGVLCPAYKTAGSGWWRDRFHFAALTGSVLLGSEAECRPIGQGYWRSRLNIEESSDDELRLLALHQSMLVQGQLWSRPKLLYWFAAIVEQISQGRRPIAS